MVEVLQFIFSDMRYFLGVAILLAIFATWTPFEINIHHEQKEGKDNGSKTG